MGLGLRRLLQYFEGAAFKAHVDSGWACQVPGELYGPGAIRLG